MKINGDFVSLSGDIKNLTEAAGPEFQLAMEGEKVRVVALPALYASHDLRNPTVRLQERLENAGYSQFSVRYFGDKIVIIDGKVLEQKLEQWVRSEGGRAAEAAEKIRQCFYKVSISLDLEKLGLKTLPPIFDQLNFLKELTLANNNLTACPEGLAELVNLKQLDLHDNDLTSFSVPPTLTNLNRLFLESNELTDFSAPAELPLRSIDLSFNHLTTFSILGPLVNLRELDLSNNPDLQTLPPLLGEYTDLTHIDTGDTGIPEELRQNILATCQARRDAEKSHVLIGRLDSWIAASAQPFNLTFINTLPEKEKTIINEWLVRLEETKDFTTDHRPALARIVCEMLVSVSTNPAFKEVFLQQVSVNLEACGDRAAMALNELYLSWRLSTLPANATPQEKLLLMQSAAKTLALRKELSKLLEERRLLEGSRKEESVEIYLYYELTLQNSLKLLTALQSMRYSQIGRSDWIKEEDLIQRVNTTYLDELCELPQLKELADQDPQFTRERDTALNPFHDRAEEIFEQQSSDAEKKSALDAVQEERAREEKRLLREWARQNLEMV
ncbi:MAG: hypothetical protein KGI80_02395 [Verrucomicrobiota bacterium]|nr:hypothetical protein [Verrucomicrobiota bacterium]